jgi:hypothetical protein
VCLAYQVCDLLFGLPQGLLEDVLDLLEQCRVREHYVDTPLALRKIQLFMLPAHESASSPG